MYSAGTKTLHQVDELPTKHQLPFIASKKRPDTEVSELQDSRQRFVLTPSRCRTFSCASRNEIQSANKQLKERISESEVLRETVRGVPPKILPSLIAQCRIKTKTVRKKNERRQNKKLQSNAGRQSKPLNSVGDTVKLLDDLKIP